MGRTSLVRGTHASGNASLWGPQHCARHHYRELLAAPGPKRITRAREAFTAAAKNLPSWIELGLVVFRECKDIRKVGVYEPDERADANCPLYDGDNPSAATSRRRLQLGQAGC